MSAVAEGTPSLTYDSSSSESRTTVTTLFDLITALQDQTASDDDDLITAVVVDLCKHSHLRFVGTQGTEYEPQGAIWS